MGGAVGGGAAVARHGADRDLLKFQYSRKDKSIYILLTAIGKRLKLSTVEIFSFSGKMKKTKNLWRFLCLCDVMLV